MDDGVKVVLDMLEQVRQHENGWSARCPAHDDHHPSLSIATGKQGQVLLRCHTGCETADVVAALGLDFRDLFPPDETAQAKEGRQEIIAVYPYRDEKGFLLYEAVRYANPKGFRMRRSSEDWSMKGVSRRVPYRLSALLKAIRAGQVVFIVEGETDVDRLAELGLVATCNIGGAGKWTPELSAFLHGARAVILPDYDTPGMKHAQDVARQLYGIAQEIRVAELPELGPVLEKTGKDVSDWLDEGRGKEDLLARAEQAPLWSPPAAPAPASAPEPEQARAKRTLPPPISVRELLATPEPEELYIADPLIPAESNILMAAYPKSGKTFCCMDLGISAATGAPFLGHFDVPRLHRIGLVLMEGSRHHGKVRLERLCAGKQVDPEALEGRLHQWFRPPLRLSDPQVMEELAEYVCQYDLDLLMIDSWSYVAEGDSNSSDQVTPQLDGLSRLREARPGLSVLLVHHARKAQERSRSVERITDLIRNSSAFGAWYDVGIALARRDEASPVTVRLEMRDHAAPEPFTFHLRDEVPADPGKKTRARGWLRLEVGASGSAPREESGAVEACKPKVVAFLQANPGCSKNQLELGVEGDNNVIRQAFRELCDENVALCEVPAKRGQPTRCYFNDAAGAESA